MMRLVVAGLVACSPLAASAAPACQSDDSASAASGSYRVSGARILRPTMIWDDGRKTFLDWPENIEAPAIFAIDAGGNESLVNSHYRDGRYVIDGVHTKLVFRLDRLVAKAERRVARS